MAVATQTLDYLIGKKGRMYSARNGTVRMFVLKNGEVWRANTGNISNVIFADAATDRWTPTATECPPYSYKSMLMTRDAKDADFYPLVEAD